MPFLRKYNTLLVTGTTAIRVPIIKRAVVDFAVGADWTPAAGDVKILVDATAAANVTNLPTAVAGANTGAIWEFVLTAAELTSKQSVVIISDAATKTIEDQCFIVETFGHASAMYPLDYSDAVRMGLTALPNVASGSAGAIPTTGTGANQISVASGLVDITQTAADKVWSTTVRTLSEFSTALALSVWNVLTAAIVTASSIGVLLKAITFTGAGKVDVSLRDWLGSTPNALVSGNVPIASGFKKAIARPNFEFVMTDSTTHLPVTGKVVTVTRSIDNGAYGAGTFSAVTEISGGTYSVDFGAGDLNGGVIGFRATAAGCDQLDLTIVPDL